MNRLHQLLAGLSIAAITLAACGGGGGGASTTPKSAGNSAPTTQYVHNQASPPPPASARTSFGTVKLALTLPHVLTGRNVQAVRALSGLRRGTSSFRRHGASSARRSPNYVNPSDPPCQCYNVLDIFVDGSLIPDIDGQVNDYDSMLVQGTSNAVQNVSLPLFSSSSNDIVVVEWDGEGQYVLAEGETYVGNFTPGTAVNATLTMLMNAAYVGILDVYNQVDAEVMTGQTYYGLSGTCESGSYPQNAQFALYSADGLGSFVPVAGYGGTSTPSMLATSDGGGSTTAAQSTIPGLYQVAWDSPCDGVTVSATTINPAYAIAYDVDGPNADVIPNVATYDGIPPYYENGGPYYYLTGNSNAQSLGGPFVNGQATYGYYDCAEYNENCPGGPYQGIWDLYWYYYSPSTNFGYYAPSAFIFPQVVSGSVDIVNSAPSPNPSSSPTF